METISIKGNLTPDFINEKLGPFLEAIENIQHTIDEIREVSSSPVIINDLHWEAVDTIENNALSDVSTITIILDEAKKAVSGLRETLDNLSANPGNQDLLLARLLRSNFLHNAILANAKYKFDADTNFVTGYRYLYKNGPVFSGAPIFDPDFNRIMGFHKGDAHSYSANVILRDKFFLDNDIYRAELLIRLNQDQALAGAISEQFEWLNALVDAILNNKERAQGQTDAKQDIREVTAKEGNE